MWCGKDLRRDMLITHGPESGQMLAEFQAPWHTGNGGGISRTIASSSKFTETLHVGRRGHQLVLILCQLNGYPVGDTPHMWSYISNNWVQSIIVSNWHMRAVLLRNVTNLPIFHEANNKRIGDCDVQKPMHLTPCPWVHPVSGPWLRESCSMSTS